MGRTTIGECLSLDLGYLEKHDLLRPGVSFSFCWSLGQGTNSDTSTNIGILVLDKQIRLKYYHFGLNADEPPEDVDEPVRLEWNVPGGYRVYFVCPRCGGRARQLHMPPDKRLFGCRACYKLGYLSQSQRRSLLDRVTYEEDRPRRRSRLKSRDIEAWQAYLKGGDISYVDPTFAGLIQRMTKLKGRWGKPGRPSKKAIRERRKQERQSSV